MRKSSRFSSQTFQQQVQIDFDSFIYTELFLHVSSASATVMKEQGKRKNSQQLVIAHWESQQEDVQIAQIEGFIRQIIGWREYMRGVYWAQMPDYKSKNFFDHQAELPEWFWTGETKMKCLSHTIRQSLEEAYAHHDNGVSIGCDGFGTGKSDLHRRRACLLIKKKQDERTFGSLDMTWVLGEDEEQPNPKQLRFIYNPLIRISTKPAPRQQRKRHQ